MQESTASEATTAGHSLVTDLLTPLTLGHQEEHSTLLPESGSHSPSPIPMLTSTVHYQDHSVSLPVSGIIARTHNMALNETAVTPEAPIAPPGMRMQHPFNEPVTIAIVLGVIAGIVGTILLIYYLISLITKSVIQEEHASV
uniref:glycophorin-A isoform X2 n=1 Tax=Myodes glareolus TaxID=447135 RepID=UPI002021C685|nr:glycophorin-A isoform X2 [Myodes glareolus]